MKDILSTNLQKARQLRDLTMDELAKMIGCSKQAISHYENAIRFPDSTTLIALAEALNVDFESLIKPYAVHFSILEVNYRQGMELSYGEKTEIEEIASKSLNNYIELEQIAKESINFENPLSDLVISNMSDAEKASKLLRKRWKLGDLPIPNVTKMLEDKGIRILKVDFGPIYQHEGLSGWAENKTIPVIVINSKQTELARVRHTLFHELAHLLLTMSTNLTIAEIEKICEVFAGTMILPTDILIREFGKNRTNISIPELKRIKEFYGISILAIMVRARFSHLISYETFIKWRNSKFSGEDFGQYVGNEDPERFNQMLDKCISENKIGIDKAVKLTGKSVEEFQNFHDNLFKF